jgi:hypothetical protein
MSGKNEKKRQSIFTKKKISIKRKWTVSYCCQNIGISFEHWHFKIWRGKKQFAQGSIFKRCYSSSGGGLAWWLERRIDTPATRVRILGRNGLYTLGCIPQRFESASAEILRYIKAFIYFIYFYCRGKIRNVPVLNRRYAEVGLFEVNAGVPVASC